jgi:endonuclease/exonuclease/phosphatase family metal-dependent hydrolase
MQRLTGYIDSLFYLIFFVAMIPGCFARNSESSQSIRIATFNASLNRSTVGQLYEDLIKGDTQAATIACIIQTVHPDLLLLNEFDYDSQHQSLLLFMQNYLAVPQNDKKALIYPYYYTASVNTGIPCDLDLDHDGKTDGPGDAFGYGQFAGQYGMVLLSKFPILIQQIRTFQNFLWKDVPNSLLPSDWYDSETLKILRLSSKSHWDIPIQIQNQTLHVLASHPTPPVFDGPEDRNGRRNHDEIRFWVDYITPDKSGYIYDDNGQKGGLDADSLFVILGDMNADPHDGDATDAAISQLLHCINIQDTEPSSSGAVEATAVFPKFNVSHLGRPRLDTYQSPPDKGPGNLRLDYVLPAKGIRVKDSGVFWPIKDNKRSQLINASDHRMVYVDMDFNRSH